MRKLTHFLLSRSSLTEKLLSGKSNYIKDAARLHNFTSRVSISTARQDVSTDGNLSGRVYNINFSIFKGKAALSLEPVLPKFTKLDMGNVRMDKRGSLMLKFWPAIGQHKYDWEKKQMFALSATELGSLISLGPAEACDFFHDPSMKTSLAGQVRKTLQVAPNSDNTGYFFNLTVVNSTLKTNERFSVPVSKAEFAVMRSAFSFILPHIMGWGRIANPEPTSMTLNPLGLSQQGLTADLEWGK
ncbi:WHIRLY 2 [Tasmannia lanceolata]|uniref:WHIRLY 2 n=1 Tax=Tasmannia lanceolata TaxID=3420 RepID=UPI0040643785